MTENTKVFLGILAGIAVGLLSLAVAGAFWLKNRNEGLTRAMEVSITDGEEIGKTGDQWACVWAAYDRSKGCGMVAPVCEMKVSMFLRHCLEHARPGTKFCDGVPQDHQVVDSAAWAYDNCTDLTGNQRERCSRVFQTVQSYCHEHLGVPRSTHTSTAA